MMNEAVHQAHVWIMAMALASIRLLAIFTVMPVLSDQMVPGMARRTVVMALALVMAPAVAGELHAHGAALSLGLFAVIAVKEVTLGIMIGFLGGIPFWVAENVGNLIDNQRGATMGEVFSPLTGSQDSPIGLLMLQVASALFIIGGAFLFFLGAVYESYRVWPVFSPLPRAVPGFPLAFLGIADHLVRLAVVLAAPAVVIMVLATFGLGLVSRAVPQMNVFFVSMPLKSALGILVLLLYLHYLVHVLGEQMKFDILAFLKGVFQ